MAPRLSRVPHRRLRLSVAAGVRVLLIVGIVVLLEAVCRTGLVSRTSLVPPTDAAARLWVLLRTGEALPAMTATLGNAGLALLLALAVGLPTGLLLHAVPRLRRALDPFLASYYAVPFFAFYPLLVAVFGMNPPEDICKSSGFGVILVAGVMLGFVVNTLVALGTRKSG